jgi:ferredoxin-NADP reductase/predicted pyridoxine 5'-phosphate oxidase superfamily flavin-nucleotide-binding protein
VLGIQYEARRRNRLTAKVESVAPNVISLTVDQTFGNCPQYIQSRNPELLAGIDHVGEARPSTSLRTLGDRERAIIEKADNFYIATHYSGDGEAAAYGADVSHRGGKPGFVCIDDDRTLTFPDFTGNFHFNTLGNILMNPLAGLLFVDFETSSLLYLTCTAEVIWDSAAKRAFDGAERLVRFTVDEGVLIEGALPVRWRFGDYSESLEHTGSWAEVAETLAARRAENTYRNYTVSRVERESEAITSFYLEPQSGDVLPCHCAGQFLPIEIQPPGHGETIRRTYTISNAPNGAHYRLSIKREPSAAADLPPGVSSNYFHDQVKPGTTVRALLPRGHFVLAPSSLRSTVLLSAGVGITPMISMLEELARQSATCGCTRKVWFIHGARDGTEQAFANHVRAIAQEWPHLTTHFLYSQPREDDVEGVHFDSRGRVDIEHVKALLPFDDYDFYFCGPTGFMESLYEGLKELNVADERIHYEFFGPGTTLLRETPGTSTGLIGELENRGPVTIHFARSGKQAVWEPAAGTLLDLAEANGLRPAYSCRSGICATCATPVVAGDVAYVDAPVATPEDNQALICCAYPGAAAGEDVLTLDL